MIGNVRFNLEGASYPKQGHNPLIGGLGLKTCHAQVSSAPSPKAMRGQGRRTGLAARARLPLDHAGVHLAGSEGLGLLRLLQAVAKVRSGQISILEVGHTDHAPGRHGCLQQRSIGSDAHQTREGNDPRSCGPSSHCLCRQRCSYSLQSRLQARSNAVSPAPASSDPNTARLLGPPCPP